LALNFRIKIFYKLVNQKITVKFTFINQSINTFYDYERKKLNCRYAFNRGVAALAACNQQGSKSSTTTTSDTTISSTTTKTTYSVPAATGFQKTVDGKSTDLYYLKNKNGVQAAITSFGGRLVSLLVPDKTGKMVDVVVGFDSLKLYQEAGDFYGATIGRYGNRIGNAKFTLDGKTYTLPANNGPNTLHGGKVGYDSQVWDAKKLDDQSLEIDLLSKGWRSGFSWQFKG
jgi:aldose 1-epimerase